MGGAGMPQIPAGLLQAAGLDAADAYGDEEGDADAGAGDLAAFA